MKNKRISTKKTLTNNFSQYFLYCHIFQCLRNNSSFSIALFIWNTFNRYMSHASWEKMEQFGLTLIKKTWYFLWSNVWFLFTSQYYIEQGVSNDIAECWGTIHLIRENRSGLPYSVSVLALLFAWGIRLYRSALRALWFRAFRR